MIKRYSSNGFSLVELAIVLVIIGLITGGILTGQDLIKSAELNSLNSDAMKYKVAFNTFKLKYNAVPGDMSNATSYWTAETCPGAVGGNATGTCNGNGNGTIDYVDWVTPTGNEHYRAWEHLALAGLIPGSYTGLPATSTSSTAAVANSNMPGHRVNGGYYPIWYIPGWTSRFGIFGHAVIAYGQGTGASLTPPEAASIDSKFDDGLPGAGLITQPTASAWPGCATTDIVSTAVYTLSSTSVVCGPIFWIEKR